MKKKYYELEDLAFSAMYGGAVYERSDRCVPDPFPLQENGPGESPLMVNVLTGETVFLRRLNTAASVDLALYRRRILDRPESDDVFWPIDLMILSPALQARCTLFVDNQYTDKPLSPAGRTGDLAAAFIYRDTTGLERFDSWLSRAGYLSWKNPAIVRAAAAILSSVDKLNRSGYNFNDVHFSRLYYNGADRVMIDYSTLINSKWEMASRSPLRTNFENNYPMEFGHPQIFDETLKYVSYQTQNYSLAALLFFLFFGRCAYDGSLLTGYVDTDLLSHYVKFRQYWKMPVFLFDEEDTRNAIGSFEEEKAVIQLWKECPETLKEFFRRTLILQKESRPGIRIFPSPLDWLTAFKELGWLK